MVTTKLIEILKAKIVSVLKMPMLKRVSEAQNCVVDSVVIIECLNNDLTAQNERIKSLELKLTALTGILNHHIKTGR